MKKNRRKRMIRAIAVLASIAAFIIVAACISGFVCNRHIKVKTYDVSMEGITSPVRIAVIADLHGKVYEEDNSPIYEKTAAQRPDVIVLLGDLFPSEFDKSDSEYVLELTQKLEQIAPVYFAMGNHESSYTAKYGDEWIQDIKNTGAMVFDESWADLEINGNMIRFGGSLGHGFTYGRTVEEYRASPEYSVFTALENSPYPSVLLAHMPDTAAFEESKLNWHFDLVLSAHTHGGVIRIPGIGGLYAPVQGLWPPYDYGEMMLNDQMRMIITSGLSGHDKMPRIFNLPEICIVDLHS